MNGDHDALDKTKGETCSFTEFMLLMPKTFLEMLDKMYVCIYRKRSN